MLGDCDLSADGRVPAITVLMAVHDGERYLREAVDSVLCQSFSDFEFLIVDDASTDSTREILDSIADGRIRILTNECNFGLTRSLNVGLAAARGAMIARMDADDMSLPDRLARQIEFLDANPEFAMVASCWERIDLDGASLGIVVCPTDWNTVPGYLRQGNCFAHGSAMFRRNVVAELSGYHEDMEPAEDYDLWLRMIERHSVVCLPDVLYRWRENPEGLSATRASEQQAATRRARRRSRIRRVDQAIEFVEQGVLRAGEAARSLADFACEQAARPMAVSPESGERTGWASWLRRKPAWQRLVLRPRIESAARRAFGSLSQPGAEFSPARERLLALLENSSDVGVA